MKSPDSGTEKNIGESAGEGKAGGKGGREKRKTFSFVEFSTLQTRHD